MLAGILGSAAWALYLTSRGFPWFRTYFGFDTRAQGLLAGCLLAVTVTCTATFTRALRQLWPIPTLILAAMILTLDNHSRLMGLGGFALAALVSSWLLAAVAEGEGPLTRLLSANPLQWVGLRSYSLFLWHYPIAQAFYSMGLRFWPFLTLVASLIVADLSYRFVERPFLRGSRTRRPAAEEQAAP